MISRKVQKTLFTKAVRNTFLRGASASLEVLWYIILLRHKWEWKMLPSNWASWIEKEHCVPSLKGAKWRHICKRQDGYDYYNRWQSLSNNNFLTHSDLWCWQVGYGVPRTKIDGQPTQFYFICRDQIALYLMNGNLT